MGVLVERHTPDMCHMMAMSFAGLDLLIVKACRLRFNAKQQSKYTKIKIFEAAAYSNQNNLLLRYVSIY